MDSGVRVYVFQFGFLFVGHTIGHFSFVTLSSIGRNKKIPCIM